LLFEHVNHNLIDLWRNILLHSELSMTIHRAFGICRFARVWPFAFSYGVNDGTSEDATEGKGFSYLSFFSLSFLAAASKSSSSNTTFLAFPS